MDGGGGCHTILQTSGFSGNSVVLLLAFLKNDAFTWSRFRNDLHENTLNAAVPIVRPHVGGVVLVAPFRRHQYYLMC